MEPKPPWDRFFVSIDCSKWLDQDTIINAEFQAFDQNGNDVTSDIIDSVKSVHLDQGLKPYIKGGISGNVYTVVNKATTDAGDQLSCSVVFECQDYLT